MKKCKKLDDLSIKFKIIVPVVVMLLLSSGVAALIVYHSISSADNEEISGYLAGLGDMVKSAVSETEAASAMLTENMANNNDIQFSIALQDTGLLAQNTAPFVTNLKKGGFLRGYFDFINADGTVIYASSNPWLKGMDLTKSRPLVKEVITGHEKAAGIEAGPDGIYVRVISPVIYTSKQ